jgi:hypothetical protein
MKPHFRRIKNTWYCVNKEDGIVGIGSNEKEAFYNYKLKLYEEYFYKVSPFILKLNKNMDIK